MLCSVGNKGNIGHGDIVLVLGSASILDIVSLVILASRLGWQVVHSDTQIRGNKEVNLETDMDILIHI